MALAKKLDERNEKVYVLVGDGELEEGTVWEAIMSAAHFKLDNLVAIIDRNHLSYDGDTEEVMAIENLADKFRSFNWFVSACDGHDTLALLKAFAEESDGKPHVIIADTVKGKGISFIENKPEWHHHRLSQEEYEKARAELLGGIE